jgi:hypothetical protein
MAGVLVTLGGAIGGWWSTVRGRRARIAHDDRAGAEGVHGRALEPLSRPSRRRWSSKRARALRAAERACVFVQTNVPHARGARREVGHGVGRVQSQCPRRAGGILGDWPTITPEREGAYTTTTTPRPERPPVSADPRTIACAFRVFGAEVWIRQEPNPRHSGCRPPVCRSSVLDGGACSGFDVVAMASAISPHPCSSASSRAASASCLVVPWPRPRRSGSSGRAGRGSQKLIRTRALPEWLGGSYHRRLEVGACVLCEPSRAVRLSSRSPAASKVPRGWRERLDPKAIKDLPDLPGPPGLRDPRDPRDLPDPLDPRGRLEPPARPPMGV